jgi:hypothetical protein
MSFLTQGFSFTLPNYEHSSFQTLKQASHKYVLILNSPSTYNPCCTQSTTTNLCTLDIQIKTIEKKKSTKRKDWLLYQKLPPKLNPAIHITLVG